MIKKNDRLEKIFLERYDPNQFDRPNVSVDIIIFTIISDQLQVLTIKRAEHPFKDCWSLVGGYVDTHYDKTLEDTAKRKLKEKTGVDAPYLEQFATIGNASRDPRGWSVTTLYFALMPAAHIQLNTGLGATEIKWTPIKNGRIKDKLAFDHAELLLRCAERLQNKILYTSIPVHFMSENFTLSDLQKVYEIILAKKIDHKSFRRRVLNADILEETEEMRCNGNKPARLYQLKSTYQTHFFLRNLESAQSLSSGV